MRSTVGSACRRRAATLKGMSVATGPRRVRNPGLFFPPTPFGKLPDESGSSTGQANGVFLAVPFRPFRYAPRHRDESDRQRGHMEFNYLGSLFPFVVHASWCTRRGARVVAHASWRTRRGARVVAHASWCTRRGARVVVHASWRTRRGARELGFEIPPNPPLYRPGT